MTHLIETEISNTSMTKYEFKKERNYILVTVVASEQYFISHLLHFMVLCLGCGRLGRHPDIFRSSVERNSQHRSSCRWSSVQRRIQEFRVPEYHTYWNNKSIP